MSNVIVDKTKLDYLANAISAKSGEPLTLTLDEMVEAVDSIEVGGGGVTPTGTITITTNGTTDVTNYAIADVQVPGSAPTLQTKTKTYTPTETAQTESVTADVGYDGLDTVSISVGAVSSTYVGTGITRRSSSDLTASGATVSVPSGYYENNASKAVASGSATPPTTISGSQATLSTGTNTITLQKTLSVTPRVTAGYVSSGTADNVLVSLNANVTTKAATTYYPSTSDQTIASGTYTTGTQTIEAVTYSNTLIASNIKKDVVVTIGDSADADRILSVTGTYEGGGGTSKNTQVVQGTTRTTSSTLTAIGAELTVSKTGTYDIYWSGFRSTTSGSYTYATQLFIDNTAYGSENATWSNHVQNNHLTNVSLTANQKLRVRGRNSRGSSYYIYAPTLVIVET